MIIQFEYYIKILYQTRKINTNYYSIKLFRSIIQFEYYILNFISDASNECPRESKRYREEAERTRIYLLFVFDAWREITIRRWIENNDSITNNYSI